MADKKTSDLVALTLPAANDLLPIVDISTNETKKITVERIVGAYFVPLQTGITNALWDGDAKSRMEAFPMHLPTMFVGVPAGVKAVAIRLACRDSATLPTGGLSFAVGPTITYFYAITAYAPGGDIFASASGICGVDVNGFIYCRVIPSGTLTMDCWLDIWGYWI